MPTINLQDLPEKSMGPVTYRVLSAEPVMMLHLIIPPNTELPDHGHVHFQIGYIISGSGVMIIAGEETAVSSGMAYTIPENVPHGLRTGAEVLEMLDIYYPPKEDRR